MAETQLITIADLSIYRKIDPKFDQTRFNSFVNSVQRNNLRDLFGDALYYAFMNDDRTSGVYKVLLDGESYTYNSNTIQYYGLKPALCFWVLALIARESDMYLSGYGAIQFMDNVQQQFTGSKQKEIIAAGYNEQAEKYANDIKQYLNEKYTNYPLWDFKPESNESSFTTFKI